MQFRLSTLLLLAVVLWSSLAVFGGVFGIVVFAWIVVAAVGARRPRNILVISMVLLPSIGFFLTLVQAVRKGETDRQHFRQCANNLKSIAMALHTYEKANGCHPPAWIADKAGHRMHSWRVLLLPYLGYGPLYRRYSFTEPWDGPNNRNLLADRPPEYACPYDRHEKSPDTMQTNYVAVVGPNAAWRGEEATKPGRLSLNPSTTIVLTETCDADIPWMEPRDLDAEFPWTGPKDHDESSAREAPRSPIVTVSNRHGDDDGFFVSQRRFSGVNAVFADGHSQYLPLGGAAPNVMPRLLTIDGATDAALAKAAGRDGPPPPRFVQVFLNWPNCFAFAIWVGSVAWLLLRADRHRRTLAVKGVENRAGEAASGEPGQLQIEKQE